jgi:hypothetical protein
LISRQACKIKLEGIVSKRKDSAYRCGRSREWLKMKNPACAAVTREAIRPESYSSLGRWFIDLPQFFLEGAPKI